MSRVHRNRVVDMISRLVDAVESTWSMSRCPWCRFKTRTVHDVRPRRVHDRRIGPYAALAAQREGQPRLGSHRRK